MSKDKRKYSGFTGDCSQDQLKALDQFRTIVVAIDGGNVDPRWDQVYLLRFLRARKFNLKETEKMWREHMAWRAKNNIDSIKVYYFPELLQLRKMFPHGYHKYTKNHSPIYIQRLGFATPEEIWKVTTPDRLLAYYSVLYEALFETIFKACSQQHLKDTGNNSNVALTCSILDLKDIKLSQANSAYKFIKPAAEMAQNNYPQMLGSMFILNSPFLFTGIWAIVKMWIDEKTKEKIHILGSGYKKELLKHIDPQNLPDFIDGGVCKCKGGCLGTNPGPWNPKGEEMFPNCIVQHKPQQQEKVLKIEKKEELKQQFLEKVQKFETFETAETMEKVEVIEEEEKVEKIQAFNEKEVKDQKVKQQAQTTQSPSSESTNHLQGKKQEIPLQQPSKETSVSPASQHAV